VKQRTPCRFHFRRLPAWENWIALQASGNSAVYGLSTACAALLCGFLGARLFGRV